MKKDESALSDDKKFEFFLTASHQLKSPVAIIQWCLQDVMERGHIPDKEMELVRKALFQANAMSQLIVDMLNVFRLQEKDRKSRLEPVNILEIVEEVFRQCEVSAHRQGVHLIKSPLETVPLILAEKGYIKQAVLNLVDNAIKYTKKGGSVTVEVKNHPQNIEIAVIDQGIGISSLEQHQLFKEFFRGQEAQAMTHEGTGLGLVLVKHIVEGFGGTIHLDSQVGKGSTFTIILPIETN